MREEYEDEDVASGDVADVRDKEIDSASGGGLIFGVGFGVVVLVDGGMEGGGAEGGGFGIWDERSMRTGNYKAAEVIGVI